MEAKADYLFEVSWEVCNKVGGIYTVVVSKILPITRYYKQNYYAIGPYFNKKAVSGEFQEKPVPEELQPIFKKLAEKKIYCHYGIWLIEGYPKAILVDYNEFSFNTNTIKTKLWDDYRIDSLDTQYHDFDEPIVWATAAGFLIEEFANLNPGKRIVAHCHEWLAGGTLLYLKSRKARIGTIFTTHATMLGRTLAANGVDLYNAIDKINPEEMAYKYGIQAKFLTEKACASAADVFTTVSEITGLEARYFLGKKPDILLPNGLDIEKFPTFEDASFKHKLFKNKIKEFILYYYFPYYTFDIDNTLVYFICGRYEFRDKGIDLYIKSLAKLNELLKETHSDKTVVAFIWIPGMGRSIREELLECKAYFEDIRDSISDATEDIRQRLVYGLISKTSLSEEFLFDKNQLQDMKKKYIRFTKEGRPGTSTHLLYDESRDEITKALKENNLLNSREDKVKVVYYPIYLTGADQLLDITYYESIMGCHLGIFPSYYEPWGYTPLETGALGVASVTTDLAGFGRYIEKESDNSEIPGIYVLKRLNRSDEDIVSDLTQIMYKFSEYSKQERIECKLKAKRLASLADWKILVENYIKAHNVSLEKF